MSRLVLASGSPRRRALLVAAGSPPDTVVAPAVDETVRSGEDPEALVRRLATAKRDAVRGTRDRSTGHGVVLAADTVVVLDDRILGKPVDERDAAAMLHALMGRAATVLTGVAVGGPDPTPASDRVERTATVVRFGDHDERTVAAYVATGEPMGAAGAFRLQGQGATLVAATEGCPTNVVGLPLCSVARLLAAHGLRLRDDCTAALARLRTDDGPDAVV